MNEQSSISEYLRLYMYYVVIFVVSVIALVFIPMVGLEAGLDLNLPDTHSGWIVWGITRALVSVINVMIFHSFMCQGKLNAKKTDSYKEAIELIGKTKTKEFVPRSPLKFNASQYSTKGLSLFIGTLVSVVGISNAVLSFDWMSFLTYLIVIVMGVVFGVLSMATSEEYWTTEFKQYVIRLKSEEEEKIKALEDKAKEEALKATQHQKLDLMVIKEK